MGQVVTHSKFRLEPIVRPPLFLARQLDVARELAVGASTIRRWERLGLLWAYDADHPDGQYVVLPTGRKRYNIERIREQFVRKM